MLRLGRLWSQRGPVGISAGVAILGFRLEGVVHKKTATQETANHHPFRHGATPCPTAAVLEQASVWSILARSSVVRYARAAGAFGERELSVERGAGRAGGSAVGVAVGCVLGNRRESDVDGGGCAGYVSRQHSVAPSPQPARRLLSDDASRPGEQDDEARMEVQPR